MLRARIYGERVQSARYACISIATIKRRESAKIVEFDNSGSNPLHVSKSRGLDRTGNKTMKGGNVESEWNEWVGLWRIREMGRGNDATHG